MNKSRKYRTMKDISRFLSVTCLVLLFTVSAVKAEKFVGDPTRKSTATKKNDGAAACLPASSSSELNINNVRVYIETSGSMWFKEVARYVVPKSGQASSMFAAALWIGGLDVTGQLKLAAIRFRQVGDDFWPGPLNLKSATISQEVCSYYDKHFIMEKATAQEHRDNYNQPGYEMPASIRDWPAHPYHYDGDNADGPSYYLAPFYDVDGDGVYTPENGDYPYYDFDNALCPWTAENRARAARGELPQTFETQKGISTGGIMADQVLKGDQTLWWVFNDKGAAHTETQGSPIGLEIRGQAFAFATNDELNNMTFYSYEIINRSSFELTETYFSQWVDPDLGYAKDDYVGCDVRRGLGYCYNGENVDGNGLVTHYGANPPAVGVDFFQGPYLDPDGYDNPSFAGDGMYGPSMFGSCEIVTGHDNLREFTWDVTGEGDDTTAYVLVRAEAINGVNFGDGIIDNERFGMRRFVYHNNDNTTTGDPSKAWEYYNMLKGVWKDNTKMRYGRNGHKNLATGPECDFMFPGDTDPCNWGTGGKDPGSEWRDELENTPSDRRFMQSAGPFTLKKGAINYITVGIPWARAVGSPWASVELLKIVDDKCQTLFENCFDIFEGPDAPDLVFREMDQQIICYITNEKGSNNYTNIPEDFAKIDPSIPAFRIKETIETEHTTFKICDTIVDPIDTTIVTYENCRDTMLTVARVMMDSIEYDRTYHFEGYQIYQLVDETVTADQLNDITKAALVFQCDVKNDVSQIINYEYNAVVATEVPTEKVNGTNQGIKHSFVLTQDVFNSSRALVNYKKYYFMAIAYAHNQYALYETNPDNPEGLYGQKNPYIASNKNIKTYTVIPHQNAVEENGTLLQATYGMQPPITQYEGQGNGGNILELEEETLKEILQNGKSETLKYKANGGPISVKVIDPLKIKGYDDYVIRFYNEDATFEVTDSTRWMLTYTDNEGVVDTIYSETAISIENEQLLLELGLSVNIFNNKFQLLHEDLREMEVNYRLYSTVNHLYSTIEFKDSTKKWLTGLPDVDGTTALNWIRSGKTKDGDYAMRNHPDYTWNHSNARKEDYYQYIDDEDSKLKPDVSVSNGIYCWFDPNEDFEKMVDRTWAPYSLASPYDDGPQLGWEIIEDPAYVTLEKAEAARIGKGPHVLSMTHLYSVDVVFTSDKSKWTRCPVVEACGDSVLTIKNGIRHNLRKSPSIDKNGIPYGTDGCNEAEASLVSTTGMGWFPGYVICIETGERLNVMYAEDSWLSGENGADMMFNPTANYYSGGDVVFGGKHYLYVFGHQDLYSSTASNTISIVSSEYVCPAYDEGKWAFDLLTRSENEKNETFRVRDKAMLYRNIMWTSIPMASSAADWLSTDATVKLRVSRPYQRWSSTRNVGVTNAENNNMPLYGFSTKSMQAITNVKDTLVSALDNVGVVPNPYYARSSYEADQLDTRIKFINLPKSCEVKIYTLNGVLVRTLRKDNADTYLEWNLKNEADVPVAGGVYLIHITDTKTKETRTLKWFGIQRPTDVNAF